METPSGGLACRISGVSARVDARLLGIKPRRDRARRLAALVEVERAAGRMIARMHQRQSRRSWIPIYGFLLSLQYDRQIAHLSSLRFRAETARIHAEAAKY